MCNYSNLTLSALLLKYLFFWLLEYTRPPPGDHIGYFTPSDKVAICCSNAAQMASLALVESYFLLCSNVTLSAAQIAAPSWLKHRTLLLKYDTFTVQNSRIHRSNITLSRSAVQILAAAVHNFTSSAPLLVKYYTLSMLTFYTV